MERRTKIVSTIGPASFDEEVLKGLVEAGANILRLNFSHGTHESHGGTIAKIRKIVKENNYDISVLLDTKGPEIRTGDIDGAIQIKEGDRVTFTINKNPSKDKISVNYDKFIDDVDVGDQIMVDSGLISMKVVQKTKEDVVCESINGGTITSKRHINLFGKKVSLESVTEKDWKDLEFGLEQDVDFFAMSFVRTAKDIQVVREFIQKHKKTTSIIAKIESFEALGNLEEIIAEADGVMVARGDLGCEVSFTKVPGLQREMIRLGKKYKKPVIVATHTLDSMIDNPIPTRAEVMDVATAVIQGADAVMLSGETANGKYPIESVETMRDIIIEAEKDILKFGERKPYNNIENCAEMAKLAKMIPDDLEGIDAIVAISNTGRMVRFVSNNRPLVPTFAFVGTGELQRQSNLLWGIKTYVMDLSDGQESSIERAKKILLSKNPELKGKRFVLVCNVHEENRFVPTVQIREF